MAEIALYYPWIDPTNGSTLRTAVLYFDELRTIVPESMEQPYTNAQSHIATQFNFLKPYFVNPNTDAIHRTSHEFIQDYDRPIIQRQARDIRKKAGKKTNVPEWFSGEKVSMEFRHKVFEGVVPDHDGFYDVAEGFGLAYMARLAANITDSADMIAYTDQYLSHEVLCDRFSDGQNEVDRGEALLARISIEALKIPSHVSFGRLWNFREKHYAELVEYREALRRLARTISSIRRADHLLEEAQRVVKKDITPIHQNMEKRLADQRIDYGTHLLEGLSTGVLTYVTKGLWPAIAASGIKIGYSSVRGYLAGRKLRNDPLAYLVRARATLR